MANDKTRRSNGEGTKPWERKDGRYQAELTIGWKIVNGKRRRIKKTIYGASAAECSKKLRKAIRDQEDGVIVAGRISTVGEWMEHWLSKIASQKVSPSTLTSYRSLTKAWITPHIGHVKLDKLTPEHLDDLYAAMRLAGRADSMVLKAHRVLSRSLTVAVRRGKLGINPATRLDAPTMTRQEVTPLTRDDARAVLAAAHGHTPPDTHTPTGRPPRRLRNAARWSVALALGLRQGEALGLCWDMIDLKAGTLRVSRAWHQPRTGQPAHLGGLKTAASRRTTTLPAGMLRELKAHRLEQNRTRLQEGPNWIGYEQDGRHYDPVFTNLKGRPVSHTVDRQQWKDLLEAAGVPDARLHDARHTAATMMLAQGVPARVAMEILGHSTINLTLGTYSHVIPELTRDAAEKMDQVFYE
ncbi:tyrosine-type recombinase/integrase [Arthrobacter rhombi]|uniref:tyrosine-type recombinase/integrase n=1 Tax=Arthrobacter rhombi TaxID=71253 RepID=UPI003FD3C512